MADLWDSELDLAPEAADELDADAPRYAPDDPRVLVAVVSRMVDWELVQCEHWYRIPLARAPRRIGAQYLAFYHTGRLGASRWSIAFYAPILRYRLLPRRALLPSEPDHPRADELYYKFELGPLEALPRPIPARALRRVTFIATTLSRLLRAREINDLWERNSARNRLEGATQIREDSPRYAAQRGSISGAQREGRLRRCAKRKSAPPVAAQRGCGRRRFRLRRGVGRGVGHNWGAGWLLR